MPARTICIMLLTCAVVGWVVMAPGVAARQSTEATGPTAGVQLEKPPALSPSVLAAGVEATAQHTAGPVAVPASGEPVSTAALGTHVQTYGRTAASLKPLILHKGVESVPRLGDGIAHAPLRAIVSSSQPDVGIPRIGSRLGLEQPPSISVDAVATAFDGLSDADNSVAGVEPPDTQVAVGPAYIMEMTNSTARLMTKTGDLVGDVPLRDFFGLPAADLGTDPRVLYDSLTGRWFAAYLGVGLFDTSVFVAASSTSDPTGGWCFTAISGSGLVPIADQPAIGVADDKFTFSVNFFQFGGAIYEGEQTVVFQKSDLLSCNPTIGQNVFPLRGPPWGTTRPARDLSSGADQYLAEFDWDVTDQLCIDKITGTPNASNVARSTNCVTVLGQNNPPDAVQGGGSGLIATGDNRAQDAIWKNGSLWVSAGAACNDGGIILACLHLIEVQTNGYQVIQDIVAGSSGSYVYYPAISLDFSGNLVVSFTESSASEYPSVSVASRAPGDPSNSLSNWQVLKNGDHHYTGTRWGDYSSAALDPATGMVWTGAEYSKVTGGVGWGTWITNIPALGNSPSPSPTPTHSPTATPTHSPTPTPTHSPTPTPTGPIWGDLSCTGGVGVADVMLGLEIVAGVLSSLPCSASADVDCNGVVNGLDVLDLLRFVDHLSSLVTGNCRAIGSA